jgi:hypothetical protein
MTKEEKKLEADMESEYITSTKIISLDEAKDLARTIGPERTDLEGKIIDKQDAFFSDIMVVVFGWKIQPDKSRKLVSKLPNGKIIFPDRSEQVERIEPGIPYICLVYEREREAFAKICAEEYQPKIYVPSSKVVSLIYKTKSGKLMRKIPVHNTYEPRILEALKEAEELGFASVKVIFRQNQKW